MDMTREDAAKALEVRDAVLRMFETDDYKTVIGDAYFKDEAMRLTLAIVDPEMQEDIEQRLISEQTRAIGHLHVFLNTKIALGNMVQASLEAEEKERVNAGKSFEVDEITGETYEVEGE